jgi:hypothetical protein
VRVPSKEKVHANVEAVITPMIQEAGSTDSSTRAKGVFTWTNCLKWAADVPFPHSDIRSLNKVATPLEKVKKLREIVEIYRIVLGRK